MLIKEAKEVELEKALMEKYPNQDKYLFEFIINYNIIIE